MFPGAIANANLILHKPENMTDEECSSLHVVRCEHGFTSAWFPTPEELKLINSGSPVYLTIFGDSHPPVYLGVLPS